MFCRKCGAEIFDEAVICPHCGVATGNPIQQTTDDSGSLWWLILGFIIPIIGLILYIVWMNEKPKNAKMAGVGALISVVLGVLSFAYLLSIAVITY